jgi:SAM-dependent methyltransferase
MAESLSTVLKNYTCPNCDSPGMSVFYEIENMPAHSVMLIRAREEALNCARGNIALGFCQECGFISNVVFDPTLHKYSSNYEENQAFSDTFNTFHRRLAARLIERFDLRNKDIIEIGCGKGDFLSLLCELGQNRGVGFDPAYVDDRSRGKTSDRVLFIKDLYSEKHAGYRADFVCCKMTLEHIRHTAGFLGTVRHSLDNYTGGIVFFQVPDVIRILREAAFWDIYYEHCSYFSAGSLARLFRKCGFDIIDLWRDYDGQYLMIAARPCRKNKARAQAPENYLEEIKRHVGYFPENCRQGIDTWRSRLTETKKQGRRSVIWGGGSKGVAFLTSLDTHDEIQYVVDINPHKNGTYIAGTGQKIVMPDFLPVYKPDVVIIMNPVYLEEIRKALNNMGLNPELMVV